MKTLAIILFLILSTLFTPIYAQSKRPEFEVGVGITSSMNGGVMTMIPASLLLHMEVNYLHLLFSLNTSFFFLRDLGDNGYNKISAEINFSTGYIKNFSKSKKKDLNLMLDGNMIFYQGEGQAMGNDGYPYTSRTFSIGPGVGFKYINRRTKNAHFFIALKGVFHVILVQQYIGNLIYDEDGYSLGFSYSFYIYSGMLF